MDVCKRCCGEVCLATLEAVDAAAGEAEDSAVVALAEVEVLVAVVVVDLAAGSAEVETLVAEVREAVGKLIRVIREKMWAGLSYG